MADTEFHRLWQRAVSFAARQHHGQLRKDGRTPYFAHPVRVALTVRHLFGSADETALIAALLHDLIEDTTTDYDDIVAAFGPEIAATVAALTKDARLPHDQREAAYDRQVAAASWQARLVKLADVYDNYCDSRHDDERQKAAVKAERAIRCAGDAPELSRAVGLVWKLILGREDQGELPAGALRLPNSQVAASPDSQNTTTQVMVIDPAWVFISFKGQRPPADKRAFFLHRTLRDWLAERQGLAIRRTLAVQDGGELVGVHVWLGEAQPATNRPFPVKIHYRLVDQVPAEHLEALLAHAYEIFFEHQDEGSGALAVISRSGRAVVFDRASEQCYVLPVDAMGNLDERAAEAIQNWQAQKATNYFVMELGQFKATE